MCTTTAKIFVSVQKKYCENFDYIWQEPWVKLYIYSSEGILSNYYATFLIVFNEFFRFGIPLSHWKYLLFLSKNEHCKQSPLFLTYVFNLICNLLLTSWHFKNSTEIHQLRVQCQSFGQSLFPAAVNFTISQFHCIYTGIETSM